METEKVFEFCGEGGSICISRQTGTEKMKFIYKHHEFDPTDEGLDINKRLEFDDFETPFQIINSKYPWYLLHIEIIHNDFRGYIINQLIQNLNDDEWSHQRPDYIQSKLEEALQIKLYYEEKKGWHFS